MWRQRDPRHEAWAGSTPSGAGWARSAMGPDAAEQPKIYPTSPWLGLGCSLSLTSIALSKPSTQPASRSDSAASLPSSQLSVFREWRLLLTLVTTAQEEPISRCSVRMSTYVKHCTVVGSAQRIRFVYMTLNMTKHYYTLKSVILHLLLSLSRVRSTTLI